MHDWHDNGNHAFACRLAGAVSDAGEPGETLMVCLNPEPRAIAFSLPAGGWQIALDSSGELARHATLASTDPLPLSMPPRAVVVLRAAVA
jgi:hypothetical protein